MCTGIRLIAKNGSAVCARTLEFAEDTQSQIVIIPRGYTFVATAPNGKQEGLSWQSKYAVVGANACNVIGIIDGVNEKGLAGGFFYFPNYAQFQEVAHSEAANSMAPWDLLTWILTNFATVAEVKNALPKIKVSHTIFGPWNIVPPLHTIVHDEQGNSLVIEYVAGKLIMHDNLLGVFTNAPSFDWHMTNLNNYIGINPFNAPDQKIGSVTLAPLGQGSGMRGLPGDFTSPSRFVRAVAFSQAMVNIENEEDARSAVFHVLNTFDIPYGVVRNQDENGVSYEFTRWTSACDLKNRRYYFRTYEDCRIRMVDLMKSNLDASEATIIAMDAGKSVCDITPL